MIHIMQYKGFVGTIETSEENPVIFGKVLGVRALISYEGRTLKELTEDFHEAIDCYLEDCAEQNVKPEFQDDPYNVCIPVSLYSKAIREAQSKGVSTEQLEEQVNMAI